MSKFTDRPKVTKQDNYNTPLKAWEDILQFIDKDCKICSPFYNDGKQLEIFKTLGYNNFFHEDIDFFDYWKDDWILLDNPPYSIKKEILKICFYKKQPFSLLLPLDTLDRQYFKEYKNGLQLVIPSYRYSFTNSTGNPPFKTIWFCWNMNEYLNTNDMLIWL